MKKIFTLLVLLCLGFSSSAQGLIGGYLQRERIMQGDKATYTYRFVASLLGESNLADNAFPNNLTINIYRKRDNARVQSVSATRGSVTTLFNNAYCLSEIVPYKEAVYRFSVVLNPNVYNDPSGYYFTNAPVCCRSSNILNVAGAASSSVMLYYELTRDAILTLPTIQDDYITVLGVPDKASICLAEPNTISLILTSEPLGIPGPPAIERRCRLAAPLVSAAGLVPFQDATWAAGYSLSNMIDASVPFRLTQAGDRLLMTVTPTKLGYYQYAIVCEEYRNGVKFSEQRHEYQTFVKRCEVIPPAKISTTKPKTIAPTVSPNICEGDTLQLNASSPRKGVRYQWQLDGRDIPNANDSTLLVRSAGSYLVVTTDSRICAPPGISEAVVVTVSPKPTVTVTQTVGGTGACQDRAILSATASGTVTYQWLKDNVNVVGATASTYEATASGRYAVQVKSGEGCSVTSAAQVVNIVGAPQVTVKITPSKPVACVGEVITLSATNLAGYTYQWLRDGTTIGTATQSTYLTNVPGNYTVRVTNTTGCSVSSVPYALVPVQPAVPTVSASLPSICPGSTATLSTQSATGATYGWLRDKVALANATGASVVVSQPGSYIVKVRDANGCENQSGALVLAASPVPTVSAGPNLSVVLGSSVRLNGTTNATTGGTVMWSPLTGLDNVTTLNPTARPTQTTTYKLSVRNQAGCEASDEVVVTVQIPAIEIPNAFTPNEDGNNDTWDIKGIDTFPDCTIEVFNRWGAKVFASKGYANQWNGTQNNVVLPVATYYYVVKLGVGTEDQVYSGTLTILK
jgi:gliding motility-associated-like protein